MASDPTNEALHAALKARTEALGMNGDQPPLNPTYWRLALLIEGALLQLHPHVQDLTTLVTDHPHLATSNPNGLDTALLKEITTSLLSLVETHETHSEQ